MRELLQQIRKALDADLYYLALYVTLTLPDILGAMESENGWATREKYIAWFDKYVAPTYTVLGRNTLTGEICYGLRCSLLHQGKLELNGKSFSRVIFVEPTREIRVHRNVLNDALQLDISSFCMDMLRGAELCLDEHEDTEQFQKNYDNFIRRHPNGLAPYIEGLPVIA